MTLRATCIALIGAISCLWSPQAGAHATLETKQATVGAAYKAVVRIGHGCEGSPTTRVRVVIPEGVIAVKPMPKPGWTLETVRGPYAKSYAFYHGAQLAEGAKELIWTGRLLDEHYDEFVFSAFIADGLAAGATLYFPVHQDCEKGRLAWTEVPAPGQDPHALKAPAPGLALQPAASKTAAVPSFKVGALVIEGPWARATPGGAQVAGGFLKITNTGAESDRLVGGTLPVAAAVEVHKMTMADNVMRMRKLADGLEIRPGQTIELKPGGYHLMFMGLTGGLTQGQTVKGTLVFAKAGSVEVEFQVAPIGAQSSGGHSHH